jgi:hypothetical protein
LALKSYLIKLNKREVLLSIFSLKRAGFINVKIKGSGLIKSLISIYKLN